MIGDAEHLTDAGNARRLVASYGDDVHYSHEQRRWLWWDGRRWASAIAGELEHAAKEVVRGIYAEAAAEPDARRRKELVAHAERSESEPRIRAMIALARSEPGVPVRTAKLDADPWLLNVENGTLDLRTGNLVRHSPTDLITKLAPVRYSPDAACPTWQAFLARVMDGNTELIRFIQRAAGYTLTGATIEQVLLMLYGRGANGKSTFLETLRSTLGDYAAHADATTFSAQRADSVRNDLARLAGARFVSSVEIGGGRRLSETLVKQLTGGDTLTARYLYSEHFEFVPRFKLWLATNHKPEIRGTDDAIWRRVRLVPFTVQIPEDEQDRRLGERLRSESTGILAWAVRGCEEWRRDGLAAPADVTQATADYRAEMDELGGFLAECCMVDPKAHVTASDLYAAYRAWLGSEEPMSQKAFGLCLAERGFIRTRVGGRGGRGWRGVGLAHDASDASDASGRTFAHARA